MVLGFPTVSTTARGQGLEKLDEYCEKIVLHAKDWEKHQGDSKDAKTVRANIKKYEELVLTQVSEAWANF